MHVLAFLPPAAIDGDARLAQVMRSVLHEVQRVGGERISVELLEPTDPAYESRAQEVGLTKREPPWGSGFSGLQVEYRGASTTVPMVSQYADALPFVVLTRLRQVQAEVTGQRVRIGLLGAGEGSPLDQPLMVKNPQVPRPPSIASVVAQAFPQFEFVPVKLKGGAQAVNSSLDGVFVVPLNGDFSARELARLDEFLMLGGKTLAVFSSATKVEFAVDGTRTRLETTALNRFLSAYGIQVNEDLVLDYASHFMVGFHQVDGAQPTAYFPGLPIIKPANDPAGKPWLDTNSWSFFWVDEVSLPFPSSLTLDSSLESVKVRPLAITSGQTVQLTDRQGAVPLGIFGEARAPGAVADQGAIVAALAEGLLPSASCAAEGTDCTRAPKPSQIVVIASRLFLTNPFLSIQATEAPGEDSEASTDPAMAQLAEAYAKQLATPTILALKNTMDWIAADEALLRCRSADLPAQEDHCSGRKCRSPHPAEPNGRAE